MSLTSYRAAPPRDKLRTYRTSSVSCKGTTVCQRFCLTQEVYFSCRVRSKRPNAIPHPIARKFDIFEVNALGIIAGPRRMVQSKIRRARIEFYPRRKMFKRLQCPAGVIPRGHDDGAVNIFRL